MTRFIPGSGWERTDYYTGYGWYGKFTTLEPGRGYWFYPTGQSYTWEYDPK
ncbi:TPA: hypothetical protein HA265_02820 [Candidatus Woesearchaeota archaeon]|nr:hypothetical protein [Candidatus Woesearchaeota archaeon]